MAPHTVLLDDTALTVAAIDHALDFDPARALLSGGTGSGKTVAPFLPAVDAMLRAALEGMRGEYDRLSDRYADLLTAAQAAVVEARTSRRNPLTPIVEALADLGELPAATARLADLSLSTAAAWPKGAIG